MLAPNRRARGLKAGKVSGRFSILVGKTFPLSKKRESSSSKSVNHCCGGILDKVLFDWIGRCRRRQVEGGVGWGWAWGPKGPPPFPESLRGLKIATRVSMDDLTPT